MTTAEFISKLDCNYIISYSFNRGGKLTQLKAAAGELFQRNRKQLLHVSASELPAIRAQLRNLEQLWGLNLMPLTDRAGAFHITALPIAKIGVDCADTERIRHFLQLPVVNSFDWMCAPIYRDALAFYDAQDKLIDVLNICFSCDRMVTHMGEEVYADTATYQGLKQVLTHLGHSIVEE
ncbi:hypothetical protein [Hymenobacter properus]|uniref:Uncharacterized protein n=1 Tax=Hymenobacter properus TaxID=2791026 RepID=A0A931FJ14_9BACT|nr:hypothetical protein [Hymenobacter properus]MBF9140010.1 hypothetical protein [Hymenobacter properus]MBR7718817.1 hypothetical protein [Microvirga sp. SRT04]